MTARVELRETRGDTVLWENPSLIFRQEWDAPSNPNAANPPDPAVFLGQDMNALERITNEFARTIVSAILEAF